MVFNLPVISNMVYYPMEKSANYIYSKADYIIAVSDTYVRRATKVNRKYKNKLAVFLGTDLDYFDKSKNKYKNKQSDKSFKIAYIGTLGYSYDIKVVIDSIKILNEKGIEDISFVVMGNGPLEQEFKNYAAEKKINCEFTGRLDYEEMIGKLCSCDIAVNPIKRGASSIINKVGDYAAAGLPVINTQESQEYRDLVKDYKIGFNIDNGDIEKLAEKIEILYNDKKLREDLGKNNRCLAEEKFNRKNTYIKIKEIIENEN